MNKKTILISVISSISTFVIFSISLQFAGFHKKDEKDLKIVETINKNLQVNNTPRISNTQINLVDAADKSLNSVVHIKTESIKEGAIFYNPLGEMFFGTPYQKEPDRKLSGSGSGVIISADGYITTNYHVIKGAEKITISLNDKRTYQANIVGTDPNTDLALLKIEAEDLQAVHYGNSDDIKIGEWVLAVGNPFDLTSTVTAGIVSAKGRNINLLKEQYAIESFIQTDAAVNPGNSGGALINTQGELIGINTAIASNTGSYTGYSFAVPVNMVKKIMNDLRNYGSVQRALLGVQIQELNPEIIKELKLNNLRGVYIDKVFENTAAEGVLKRKDIVLSINNHEISSLSDLQEHISQYGPGDEILIKFLRDGKINTATTILKNTSGTTEIIKNRDSELIFGAKLKTVEETLKEKLKIKNGIQIELLTNGKFKNEGLKEGLIITHLDKKPITNTDQFKKLITNKKGGVLIEGIYPNGKIAYYGFGL